jgi:hypothetical protein
MLLRVGVAQPAAWTWSINSILGIYRYRFQIRGHGDPLGGWTTAPGATFGYSLSGTINWPGTEFGSPDISQTPGFYTCFFEAQDVAGRSTVVEWTFTLSNAGVVADGPLQTVTGEGISESLVVPISIAGWENSPTGPHQQVTVGGVEPADPVTAETGVMIVQVPDMVIPSQPEPELPLSQITLPIGPAPLPPIFVDPILPGLTGSLGGFLNINWSQLIDQTTWNDRIPGLDYVDPLAQTFLIEEEGGVFITSLDLYFKAVDEGIPVTVQIRTVENGVPTSRVVPFSSVTKIVREAECSDNASIGTTFTFDAPVHLQQGVEYAFVVMLTSNSIKHRLFVSEVGQFDLTNPNFRITKQPYNGVMFKSANSTTWTPEQTKDIKFRLNRAVFRDEGSVRFHEAVLPTVTLENNPFEFTPLTGGTEIRVFHKNHGHFAGSYVTLSGAVQDSSGGTLNGIDVDSINTTHEIDSVEADSYVITIAGEVATDALRDGGATIVATQNLVYDTFHPIVQGFALPGTAADWAVKTTTGRSLAGIETPYTVATTWSPIRINDNTNMAKPGVVASAANTGSLSTGTKSFLLKGDFSTSRNNISPVIDLERLSLVTVANRIDNPSSSILTDYNLVDNFVAETEATGGSALAKYITRKIELSTPAEALKIYFLANRPGGSDIQVYYKILENASDSNFDDIGWTLTTPTVAIPITDNPIDYTDIEYDIDETELSDKIFTAFAVKIVFTSNNSSAVPTLRDFRAIAVT